MPKASGTKSKRGRKAKAGGTASRDQKLSNPEPESSVYENDTSVFFWRPHTANGFLSQWYVSPFTVDGVEYRTAEMWMMVQKAKLFGDEAIAAKMLKTHDPKAHKALGRKVQKFDVEAWDENKSRIVEEGSWYKFSSATNAHQLQKLLLDTGDKELVEASPLDRIWGVGYSPEKAEANRDKWGENLLGKALMKARDRLRDELAEKPAVRDP